MNDYYRLDYIQSSGTQYIDTGVTGNRNIKLEAKVNKVTASTNKTITIFGNMENESADVGRVSLNISTSTTSRTTRFGYGVDTETSSHQSMATLNTDYVIEISKNGLFIDGVNFPNNDGGTTLDGNDFTCGNLYLFAINGLTSQTNWFNGNTRIYYAKIYDNGTLTRDFIPVMRKSDSVVGMYDLANNVFYTNAGSGTFTYGQVLCDVTATANPVGSGTVTGTGAYTSGTSVTLTAVPNSGYEFTDWTLDGYTRLEYIESYGTQYIDTGFKPNQDTRINAYIQAVSLDGWMLGSRTNYNNKAFGISSNFNGDQTKDMWNYGNGYETPSQIFSTSEFVDVDLNKNELYKNGVLVSTRSSQTFQTDFNAYLFNANLNGSLGTGASSKWKWCKIYDNGVLVRDFVPVIRHSDLALGMLDLVNMKFYGNSATTGGGFIGGDIYAS